VKGTHNELCFPIVFVWMSRRELKVNSARTFFLQKEKGFLEKEKEEARD